MTYIGPRTLRWLIYIGQRTLRWLTSKDNQMADIHYLSKDPQMADIQGHADG